MVNFNGSWDVNGGESFFNVCNQIVQNDELFTTFKTNSLFCNYIGNDIRSYEQCIGFLKNINNELLDEINKYKQNDILGSPPLHYFKNIGSISSGTLYFLSILSRILNNFSSIKDKNICEIGSGYGGQAKIILDFGVSSYTCIDEKRPLSLCQRYLRNFNHQNVVFYDNQNIKINKYDLVISNWCLSELDDVGIDFYIQNVISHSSNGYFEMNLVDLDRKNKLIEKLKTCFKEVTVIPEIINTGLSGNFLLICKNNKNV